MESPRVPSSRPANRHEKTRAPRLTPSEQRLVEARKKLESALASLKHAPLRVHAPLGTNDASQLKRPYTTTAGDYGAFRVTPLEAPLVWHGRSHVFTTAQNRTVLDAFRAAK